MYVVIINGSPRVQKYSNTEKIIASFTKGFKENPFANHGKQFRRHTERIGKF